MKCRQYLIIRKQPAVSVADCFDFYYKNTSYREPFEVTVNEYGWHYPGFVKFGNVCRNIARAIKDEKLEDVVFRAMSLTAKPITEKQKQYLDNVIGMALKGKWREFRTFEEIPYFIQKRGCINCEQSRKLKENTGKDYGYDHELMVKCIMLCEGYTLAKPFIDPEDAACFAKKESRPELIKAAKKYCSETKKQFGRFYDAMGISIDEIISKL